MHVSQCPRRPEAIRSHGPAVPGGCELSWGAGNRTQVLVEQHMLTLCQWLPGLLSHDLEEGQSFTAWERQLPEPGAGRDTKCIASLSWVLSIPTLKPDGLEPEN